VRLRDERLQIRRLDAEITSYPDRTLSMIKMARIFGDLELYDDCYAWLHRARGKASLDAEPEYWLGHYLMEEGRAKHASVAFKRALEKDSTRVDARVELGYAEMAQGVDAEALADLRKAAASGKADATVDYNIACLLARRGEVDESFRFLSDAVRKGYSNRQLLETDPDLRALRGDPRFARIIADLH
jgi:tetratricopeptide (TPR) repeat protein